MSPQRFDGWSVSPSFVANGPTSPVSILVDEASFTQFAGDPAVAWQVPWEQMHNVQLVRYSRGIALFATVASVRYVWRSKDKSQFSALQEVVASHGGSAIRRQRRAGAALVAVVVMLGALAGTFASLWPTTSKAQELADARAINLTLKDLPSGWAVSSTSMLGYLFPPSTQVVTSTSTTLAPKGSMWSEVTSYFQRCLGVSNAKDRVYGSAGQMPDYQVSSPIFASSSLGGIEVASTSQYYASTNMVQSDLREMSRANFGACFASSNAAIIMSAFGATIASASPGSNYQPMTFASGWTRGGVATIIAPGVTTPLHLVMVISANGHYETTLAALVLKWPQTKSFVANLVNTLLTRMSPSTSAAV